MHKFILDIGDWSCDGHEKSYIVVLQSNQPLDAVRASYLRALKKTRFNFGQKIASDYEDNSIKEKDFKKLEKFGATFDLIADPFQPGSGFENGKYNLYGDAYLNLWLWFVRLGAGEDFVLEECPEFKNMQHFHIAGRTPLSNSFGYGLF